MTMKKTLWKALSLCLCAVLLNTACSDEDEFERDNGTTRFSTKANNVEPSSFSNYIDWQTYVGNDFYRYATGAWQDRTTIKPGGCEGTNQEQSKMTKAYLKKVYTEGGVPEFTRLFQAYSKANQTADKNKVRQKLANIDASVTTKEQAWKKMAQLIKEGYWAPLDFAPFAVGRKVYPALISNTDAWKTDLPTVGYFIDNTAEAANCFATGIAMSAFFKDAELPQKVADNRRCCDERNIVLMGSDGLTRSSVAPDNSPLGMILKELNVEDDKGMAIYDGYQKLNELLEKFSLAQLKQLMKYCVIDRDRFFVAMSDMDAGDVVEYLVMSYNSPVSLNLCRHFCQTQVPAMNRTNVTVMAEYLRSIFMNRLERNSWLSAESKVKAKDKLKKMYFFIGWPDQWNSNLEVKVSDAAGLDTYDLICDLYKQRVVKHGKYFTGKTDKDDILLSEMTTMPTYIPNAIYNVLNNFVFINASNLIPPIYDPSKTDAYNYAILGATTIGHEITHGFDTDGAEYDANGNEGSILTASDKADFKTMTAMMDVRFNHFTYGGGIACDGVKTECENIADNGGLNIAYEGYIALTKGGDDWQRYAAREYFRGFAFGWMEKNDAEYCERYKEDIHAAPNIRVNGNVYLMDEFYDAFDISDGSLYVKKDNRIHIW